MEKVRRRERMHCRSHGSDSSISQCEEWPAVGHAYLEDRGACREALGDLSNKGQVLESGVIVIQVQQVDKNCGTAGGSQGWPPTCRNVNTGAVSTLFRYSDSSVGRGDGPDLSWMICHGWTIR